MYEVKYSDKPAPHIIIDDFLPHKKAQKILEEAIALEPFYKQSGIARDEHAFDNCPACKAQKEDSKLAIRDNSVVFMDEQYKEKRKQSEILKAVDWMVTDSNLIETIKSKPSLFSVMPYVNTSETILSRYGRCDFYNWHTDNGRHIGGKRLLTFVYYFNEIPERFEGGELCYAGPSIEGNIKIKPKHNRLVIFPSDQIHCVNYVKLPEDDFSGGRFSLNIWVGFDNVYKF